MNSSNQFNGRVLIEGQFCGHASLSIVNRSLAAALIDRKVDVRILPTDRHEGIEELSSAGLMARVVSHAMTADVHLRNAWPPETSGMSGKRNGFVCWAWEESEIPAVMAHRFNRDLDFILTTANYVSAALRRSGVTIPCPMVGNGADHILSYLNGTAPKRSTGRKRLLHLSTFLPRKAPEHLVTAFTRAFAGRDDVELYIKTSPNPHTSAKDIIGGLAPHASSPPPIILDERKLSAVEIAELYRSADGLVLVSRGEGFGLPLAEAMSLGIPVIAARHGGQADFCTDETAYLVDSAPAKSRSHVASAYGLWEDPSVESLASAMVQLVDSPELTRSKAEAANSFAKRSLTWAAVADRVIRALSAPPPAQVAAPEYEVVSTWNEECGLATYSAQLYNAGPLSGGLTKIWARRPLNGNTSLAGDESRVQRVWGHSGAELQQFADLVGSRVSAPYLWFQHHPGYFSSNDMRIATPALRRGRRKTLITLHNVKETLRAGADWLHGFDVVVAHSAEDVEELGRAGFRAEVLPHGVLTQTEPRKADPSVFNVGTFGFLTEHKNIELLIAAVHEARRSDNRIRLILANAARRERQSLVALSRVKLLIEHLGMEDVVSCDFSFLPDEEVVQRLSPCDLLVFPYGPSLEGASGAARMAVALNRPVLLSKSEVFRDLLSFSHLTKDLTVATLAEALLGLANDPSMLHLHDGARARYANDHSWTNISRRAAALMSDV